jgi:hypothetical protein
MKPIYDRLSPGPELRVVKPRNHRRPLPPYPLALLRKHFFGQSVVSITLDIDMPLLPLHRFLPSCPFHVLGQKC